jgi:hypothetical protein
MHFSLAGLSQAPQVVEGRSGTTIKSLAQGKSPKPVAFDVPPEGADTQEPPKSVFDIPRADVEVETLGVDGAEDLSDTKRGKAVDRIRKKKQGSKNKDKSAE